MDKLYKPLKIWSEEIAGYHTALEAMRLPFDKQGKTDSLDLASRLVRSGDDHGKFSRGVIAWVTVEMQAGFMIELDTYRIGREVLSTSSSMHNELKDLKGAELAEEKQRGIATKVYRQTFLVSYQTLRRIHMQRRGHRHPDWQIFCDFIETLPYYDELIRPKKENTK